MGRNILKRVCLIVTFAALMLGIGISTYGPLTPVTASAQVLAPSPEPMGLAANPNIFSDLAAKVVPSVVNISASLQPPEPKQGQTENERFRREFEEFFGFRSPFPGGGYAPAPPNFPAPQQGALGTGVVVEVRPNEAIILTNYHVVHGSSKLQIQFDPSVTEEKMDGHMLGEDKDLDLALVKVKLGDSLAKKIQALPFGNSDTLRVGEFVMAVGNPFGQGHSVSHGIISGKDRSAPIIGKYLQTDAPINPGNSGGPLVNLKGEIIGINNAILAKAQGIGFAIPSNSIQNVLPELKSSGKVERGYLGIMIGEVTPEAAAFSAGKIRPGVPFIAQVEDGSPAAKAGLAANDVLLAINQKPVKTPEDVLVTVTSQAIGTQAKVTVLREGKEKVFNVTVTRRPT